MRFARVGVAVLALAFAGCKGQIREAAEGAQKAAAAIDPFKIEARVSAERALDSLKAMGRIYKETSGVDAATMDVGPFDDDTSIFLEVVNAAVARGRAVGTVEVVVTASPPPAGMSGDTAEFLRAGANGTVNIAARTAAQLTIYRDRKITFTATGSNRNADSRQVAMRAFFLSEPRN